jgi:hypothetical protein
MKKTLMKKNTYEKKILMKKYLLYEKKILMKKNTYEKKTLII